MKNSSRAKSTPPAIAGLLLALGIAGCAPHKPAGYQGYLEGDFVYVAAPLAGQLETLAVTKGQRVTAGAPLFTLEHASELAAQRQSGDQLHAVQARLDDLKKGQRPSEIAASEARLAQARSAAELARLELDRQAALFKSHTIPASDYDQARLTYEQDTHAVDDLAAQLDTARLGGRPDAIAAAEADVRAAQAAEVKADWSVSQKSQLSPCDAFVYDTLYRQGEFVAAGNPVVSLLPPANIKVRFFVPESEFATIKAGETVHITFDGRPPLDARVSYLSPNAEYTPPVLYNRDNRAKLVFMVEAVFADSSAARDLHPGQPVDVTPAN
ncbi:MAG TPA: HlyD family efflux transporter periplasmic adaptor subunit [Rariglobus sp.]|jgi:HlyD family secretion protein|nr:HlyD family efflux transporter periplasmic adaptor subunit [Rariglobus sp.]